MSKTRLWITLSLALIALALIGWNISGFNQQDTQATIDDNEPSSQSQHTVTVVFNPVGQLNYKLVAEEVQNFNAQQLTWFTRPVMTMFDENAVATWTVRADRAKLTDDKMLYLYSHVEVDSLTPDAQLQKIKTDNAQVNLITQDVSSDDEVTLFGVGFTSNGMKMRGNLRDKTAELIEKVKTSYEIQK
ncbi:LPS export ABC transporter periplasmic protein LptC [Yersinia enterocolitica]|uniref:LPS export ABC transporter periplasmic protein LptC n=1 Tax=Yersinia enterocolitica TaxID=630 RepID=UPI00338F4EE8